MTELEELLLKEDYLIADDKYISDCNILIDKNFLYNKPLKQYKTCENIFELTTLIPYGKGEDFDCTGIGTECLLMPNYVIIVKYDENYGFDYKYIKMILSQLKWEFPYFTVIVNEENVPVLKFWGEDNKFIGCLCGYYMRGNRHDRT